MAELISTSRQIGDPIRQSASSVDARASSLPGKRARRCVGHALRATSIAVLLTLVGVAPTAEAESDVVTWPTYLRTAPSRDAVVVGELPRGKPVQIDECTPHWCRAIVDGAVGYLDRRHVGSVGPAVKFESGGDPGTCFPSQRAGYEAGQPLAFCPQRAAVVSLPADHAATNR